MKHSHNLAEAPNELRLKAERLLTATSSQIAKMPTGDVQRLVHELQVHQIELEMQNDELRRTQRELEATRERLLLPYDAAPIGFLSMDELGIVHESNLAAARLMDHDRNQLNGRKLSDFIAPDSQDTFHLHRQRLLGSDEKSICELHMVGKASLPFVARLETVKDSAWPNPDIRWLVMISDITEQKQAEDALRESEARFRTMAEGAPVMIWMSGPDKHCTYFNKPWLEFRGRTVEQEAGNGWTEGVHANDLPVCLNTYNQSFDARKEFRMEYRLKRHDGQYRWILDHGIPRFTAQKDFIGYIGSCIDITWRKEAEMVLQQAQGQLEDRVQQRTKELTWANTALRGEKTFSDSLIELAPAIIAVVDNQGNLIRTNAYAEHLAGYPFTETQGRNMIDLFVPNPEQPRIRQLLQEALNGNAAQAVVAPLQTRDGSIRQIEWFSKPLANGSGELSAVLAIGHDITDRKQAEDALRESELRFRQLADAIEQVFWMTTSDRNKVIYISPAYARIWGQTCQSLYDSPRNWLKAVHRLDRVRVAKMIAQNNGADRYDLEYRIRRPDGSERWIRDRAFPVWDGTQKVPRIAGIADDITEQKRMEEELRRSEHHLQSFFNLAPIGLAWLSPSGTILRANQAQLDLLGYSAEEYLGHSFLEFSVDSSQGQEFLDRLAKKETVRNLRMARRCKDGTIRHVLVDANPFWSGKRFQYSSIFLRDITDRLKLEQEILHVSEREHRRIAQDLHDGLGQLLVGAAYMAGTLRQDLAAKSPATARKAGRIVKVLTDAIWQTRDLSRGLHPVEAEPSGLMSALESLAARTKKLFNIRCHFSCRRPVPVQDNMVATHLFRIAQESITNAIKHGRPGNIEIGLTETPGRIILAVEDNGKGLPVRQRKRVGMGIRIMRYRAGMCGGSLVIQKSPGGGTTVVCTVHLSAEGARHVPYIPSQKQMNRKD